MNRFRRDAVLSLSRTLALLMMLASMTPGVMAQSLTPAESSWLRQHPVIRYGANPAAAPISYVEQQRHWGYTADYMRLLAHQLGIQFQFVALPNLQAALKAVREKDLDLLSPMNGIPVQDGGLIFTSPLLEPGPGSGSRMLVIGVRGDWPELAAIIDKAHHGIPPEELAALQARWRVPPERGYSTQQLSVVVLTLAAGSLGITLLIVLWSALKRRGLARDVERSGALFDAFFNASPAGMAILDRNLRFVRTNTTLTRMYGRDATAYADQSFEQFAPEMATTLVPLMREVMISGRGIHNVEVVRPGGGSGQDSHWLASFFPIQARAGQTAQGVGQVVLDIGDRKRAELALRESENRLHNVSNHLPVAVFQYRPDIGGKPGFSYVSEGIVRLLQRSAGEVLADPGRFMSAIHEDDRKEMLGLITDVAQHRRPLGEVEWTGRRHPDCGPECWLQIRATVDETADGHYSISGVILDITQLKGVQQALERSRAELRRLSAHREELVEREHQRLAREFHDELGQVLTTARMHLQLLERNLAAGTPDTAAARDTVKDIDGMVADAYRSVKTIASDLRPAALNLGLTAAVEWLAGRVLRPVRIRCAIAFDPAADSLDGDYSIALFRIVQESLTNIVRHAEADNVRIGMEVEEDCVRLDVTDNGRGFDASQVDRSARFGLLGISERVESLGGTLAIHSAPGEGTHLTVTLPYTPQLAEAIDRSSPPS